jgi:hypothetical protein
MGTSGRGPRRHGIRRTQRQRTWQPSHHRSKISLQATEVVPEQDAEPGRILHETRNSEMAGATVDLLLVRHEQDVGVNVLRRDGDVHILVVK